MATVYLADDLKHKRKVALKVIPRMKPTPLFLLCVFAGPVAAQNADVDVFRDLLKGVAQLPVDRIELEVDPAVILVGVSAVSADARGNIYVIHRPSTGDPVVVLDPTGRFLRSWGS